jgi:hypothetical protein
LKGWAKVELDVSETKNVEIEIGRLSVGYWDEGAAEEQDETGRWVAERGVFECWIGASAGDIRYVFYFSPLKERGGCICLFRDGCEFTRKERPKGWGERESIKKEANDPRHK